MNFDHPQPSSAYPPSELVCSSVLVDLPTNKDFTELMRRKSEKLVFHKAQVRAGSSPNPVPIACVLVLNNDRNERTKLKVKNDALWKNDGVPVIAADFGGNSFVKTLSGGSRIGGADYVVGDMDSMSRAHVDEDDGGGSGFNKAGEEEDDDEDEDERRKKRRKALAQLNGDMIGDADEEERMNGGRMAFVNREQVRKPRFENADEKDTAAAAAGDGAGNEAGAMVGELIDLSRDQDTNDMEKCLNFILERGKDSLRDPVVSDVVIFNAMGGRFDHEFANISALLKAPGLLKGGPSYVCYDAYDNGATDEEKLGIQISFPIRRGYTVLKFKVPAKSLGIFPLKGRAKVWTSGLKWNLGENKNNSKKKDDAAVVASRDDRYIEMGRKISSSNETTFADESKTKVTDVHVKCDRDVWFTARIR